MCNKIYRQIYRQIKKHDKIVIARHVGPDPDALGSSLGLKEIIKNTFPKKQVYTVGAPTSKFKYFGNLDQYNEDMSKKALLIVTDTPDKKRVDDVNVDDFDYVIKIDHHPFIEKYADIEFIDDKASSASQMIMELTFNTKLKMSSKAAESLYLGLVADTNRFLFYYTTSKTFALVSRLIKETNIDIVKLYDNLYFRPLKEIKFQGFIANNFVVTENGLAYLKITEETLKEYDVDTATAGNMVNNFNYIDEIIAWAIFSEDKNNCNIRGSIRSRGPIINEVASNFGGGGHMFASGVRLNSFNDVDKIVIELDKVCKEYKEKELN